MQRLEVGGAVRSIYGSLGVKRLIYRKVSKRRAAGFQYTSHRLKSFLDSPRTSGIEILTFCFRKLPLNSCKSTGLSYIMGFHPFHGKVPHPLLWSGSRDAHGKVINGMPNRLKYCIISVVYILLLSL